MRLSEAYNDLKVLFFIVNSITGLLAGLLTFSLGVGSGVVDGLRTSAGPVFVLIIVGLIMLGVAALGYTGAILQNRVMLFIYTGFMVLAAVLDIVGMVMSGRPGLNSNPTSFLWPLAWMIVYLGLLVLAVVLALILALWARAQSNQGMILRQPPATYNLLA